MKKYRSLIFYIKNKKIKFNSILSNYVTPICEILDCNVDTINYYGDFFGEEVEKQCEYNKKQIFQNYYIDLNNKYLQQLSFFKMKSSNNEWPIFNITFKYIFDKLELRIDYNTKNMDIQVYNAIIDIIKNNNMELVSSFSYDYNDKYNILLLCGSEVGLMTYSKKKLLKKVKSHDNYHFFDEIVGIFDLNYIDERFLTLVKKSRILEVVGDNNYICKEDGIIFRCNNSLIKHKIEKILNKRNLNL